VLKGIWVANIRANTLDVTRYFCKDLALNDIIPTRINVKDTHAQNPDVGSCFQQEPTLLVITERHIKARYSDVNIQGVTRYSRQVLVLSDIFATASMSKISM